MARDNENPFFGNGGLPARPERGSDAALQQLNDHCDFLNQREANMGSRRRWRVVGEIGKREVAPYFADGSRA